MIFKFFLFYYNILIIKYLTPVHIIFYGSILYFIIKIIALIYNKIITSSYIFNRSEKLYFIKYILDIFGNFIAIFGFLIYLELIELRFCKLNYKLRITISKRSIDDINQSTGYEGFNEEDEQSEKENSKISELESNSLWIFCEIRFIVNNFNEEIKKVLNYKQRNIKLYILYYLIITIINNMKFIIL